MGTFPGTRVLICALPLFDAAISICRTSAAPRRLVTMDLSPKHTRFVAEYLTDLNATRAYRAVYGVSQKVAEASGPGC
jgi:hypothetical protein